MGTDPVDSADHIPADAIPVVDLRLLSQSDLDSLALLSGPAARAASDIVVPKIDRSVFNESVGGRKQTYSRLRLAPARPSASSSPLARRRRLLPGPPSPPSNPSFDSEKAENKRIVAFLRDLFDRQNSGSAAASSGHSAADKPADMSKAMVVFESRPNSSAVNGNDSYGHDVDNVEKVEVLNTRGELVDVAALENNKDLFGDELRRRTNGLQTEAELLEYLRGLNGTWGSRRKKRKIVDAEEFGNDLPRGWKVILGVKRKDGRVWLYCRRFISPSGRQFASCKEVSSYLQPYIGTQDGMRHISSQINESSQAPSKMVISSTLPQPTGNEFAKEVPICYAAIPISSIATNPGQQVVLFRVENPAKAQLRNLLECRKCNLTFDCKDTYVQHLMSVHQRNAKRTRLGKSVGDGVIMNGDKYECQFCHKIFDERRRYNGHVGIHVRNYGKSLEEIPDEIIVQTSIDRSILAVMPPVVVPQIVPGVVSPTNVFHEKGSNSLAMTSTVKPLNAVSLDGKQEVHDSKVDHDLTSAPLENSQKVSILSTDMDRKPSLNHETPQSAAKIEDHWEMDECMPADKIDTTIKTMDVDAKSEVYVKSAPKDMDDHKALYDATSVPNKTGSDCEMIEDKIVAPFEPTSNSMDTDFNRHLNDTTSVPVNKEIGCGRMENKVVISVDPSTRTMDMDPVPCLNDATPLVIDREQSQDIPRDSSSKILASSSNTANIAPNEDINDNLIFFTKIEKVEHEVPYSSDLCKILRSSNAHPHQEQSPCAETSGQELRNEKSVLLETGQPVIKVEGALGNCSGPLPNNDQISNLKTKFDINVPSDGKLESPVVFETGKSANKMGIDMGHIFSGSDNVDVIVADIIESADEQNLLESMVADSAAPLMPPSDCFPNLDSVSLKGESEFTTSGAKLTNLPGFEDLRLEDMEPSKLGFVAGEHSNSLPEDSMYLGGGTGLGERLDSSVQFEWDVDLPKMVGTPQLTTVCVWCRVEFSHEGLNPDAQSDSVGFMCPTCKAKISGQLSGLDGDSL